VNEAGEVYPDLDARSNANFMRAAAAVVTVAIVGGWLSIRHRVIGRGFLFGAFLALVIWASWRASAARVLGANLWLVGVGFAMFETSLIFAVAYFVPYWLRRLWRALPSGGERPGR
jgi:hypothetical protein